MRLSHSKKDWQVMQNIKDLELRKKVEEVDRERNRMDLKAQARAQMRLEKSAVRSEEEDKLKAKEENERRLFQLAQQEQAAAELVKLHREGIREIKLRQQLRENSLELRQLEAELRKAYVNKELHAQIQERQAAKLYEEAQAKRVMDSMNQLQEKQKEEEEHKELEEYKRKLEYRKDLQVQMQEKACLQEEAFQQFLRDKLIVDDITRIIHEEDMREEELKMLKRQRTKEEMEHFRLAKEAWKAKEKDFLEEEDRKLVEYWVQKDAAHELFEKASKETKEAFEKRQKMVMDYILDAKVKRQEQMKVMEELAIAEHRMKEEQSLRAAMEETMRRQIALKETIARQRQERLKELERESQMDEQFRQQWLLKFAEDERIDQMTRERRRQKLLEHKKAAQEILEDRQRRRVEEMRSLKEFERLEEEQIKMRHKLIEEERLRMLREHAVHLLGYLPKGVLQPNDLPHIGSTVVSCKNNTS